MVWQVVGGVQHWDQAAMRAIENGRYLARAANTGVSGFVDPYGRVLEKSRLFEQAVLVQDLRLVRTRTIYTRTGDLIAWMSLAFIAAAVLASWRKSHRGLNLGSAPVYLALYFELELQPSTLQTSNVGLSLSPITNALSHDDQLRRSEDLARRAGDLRSYL